MKRGEKGGVRCVGICRLYRRSSKARSRRRSVVASEQQAAVAAL